MTPQYKKFERNGNNSGSYIPSTTVIKDLYKNVKLTP